MMIFFIFCKAIHKKVNTQIYTDNSMILVWPTAVILYPRLMLKELSYVHQGYIYLIKNGKILLQFKIKNF